MPPHCLVVGAGVFGLSAADALLKRGHRVTIVDANLGAPSNAHRLSSSDDISKILRGDYGQDSVYFDLYHLAAQRWRALEAKWAEPGIITWTGVGFVTGSESSFERASMDMLLKKRPDLAPPIELDSAAKIRNRLAGLNQGVGLYEWGYVNPNGGWAISSRVVSRMIQDVSSASKIAKSAVKLLREGSRVVGVLLDDGSEMRADETIVCCGAWTRFLVEETRELLAARAMPVWHIRASRPVPDCPVCLDIAQSGFYMFPNHPVTGVVKLGHHGAGFLLEQAATAASLEALAASLKAAQEIRLRQFLARSLPLLVDDSVVDFHLCQYCDSHNGDFLIDRVPEIRGLVVACGGSGHGFKFAPVIGDFIVAAVEGRSFGDAVLDRARERFKWRDAAVRGSEAARSSL